MVKEFECVEHQKTRTVLLSWICYTGFKYSRLIKLIKRLELWDRLLMDPERDQFPRIAAPRPAFMSKLERKEYAEIHAYIEDRRRRNVRENQVHCRFYNLSQRNVDIIWCRGATEEDYIFATIPPRRYVQIMTYQGHPWIFRATDDSERMGILGSSERIHYPETAPSKFVQTEDRRVQAQAVFIRPDINGTTLKHLAIKQIGRTVAPDNIFPLNLPINLLTDMIEYYINKMTYVYALHPIENSTDSLAAMKTMDRLKTALDDLERQACNLNFQEIVKPYLALFNYPFDKQSSNSLSLLKRPHDETETDQRNQIEDGPAAKRQIEEHMET
ncbi:hypothetical protein M3Y98_00857200 [Aphelenchoides besseyi]|nr:hypothetical protein M3Y98_00857200 [Aphelenchoides besseyi]KAI6211142.1 hypothetical protein M3Y96_00402300 [Aphelenchoides besseyi]